MTEKQYNLRAGYYHNYTGICSDTDENLTTNEVINLLNNYDAKLTEIEEIVKNFDGFWTRIPKGYCSSFDGVYIVMKKMLETIKSIREEVNDD